MAETRRYIAQPPSSIRGWWRVRVEYRELLKVHYGATLCMTRDEESASRIAAAMNMHYQLPQPKTEEGEE